MSPSGDANILDYAAPPRREPQEWRYFNAMKLWLINAGVAIALLLTYAVAHWFVIAMFGLLWLLVGGLLNIAAIVNGCIYFWTARAIGYRFPHTRQRAMAALWLPLSNIVLAILCTAAGIWMMNQFEPHFGDGD